MKVKINTHGNALPEVHGEWIDLCTAEDVTLDFLEYKIISLGVSIEIPAGYYAHVVPRSSTFGKWGILLANSMGVIENDYCGDGDVWGYTVKDQIPMGHGEKSVYLVMKHMELTDDEALAIRWHMGAYDDAFRGGSRALNAAMERTPLVLELHYADMIATQREKNEEVL